jgi:hypothetical protein
MKSPILLLIIVFAAYTTKAQWQHSVDLYSTGNIKTDAERFKTTPFDVGNGLKNKHKADISKTKTVFWKCDTVFMYNTNDSLTGRIVFNNDVFGNQLSYIMEVKQDSTWGNWERHTNTYDAYGNVVSYLFEQWNSSTWILRWRTVCTYDLNKNMLSSTLQDWSGSWVNRYRWSFMYDNSGNRLTDLTEEWWDNTWNPTYLYTFTYDGNGNNLTVLYQKFQDGYWVNSGRTSKTYDGSGHGLSGYTENWQIILFPALGVWLPADRETLSYDVNENLIIDLVEEYQGNNWLNSSRETYTYDIDGNVLTDLNEEADYGQLRDNNRYTYTYNSDGNSVTGKSEYKLGSSWVPGNESWTYALAVYSQKDIAFYIDSYYYRYVAKFVPFYMGVSEENPENNSLKIFPNPAGNYVSIDVGRDNHSEIIFNLYTITGQLVETGVVNGKEQKIDISKLDNGVYVLSVQSYDYTANKKLVIQR